MKKLFEFLKGKKTFILAGLGGVTFALARLGYIDPELEANIYTFLGIGTVAAFRDAVKK